MEPNACNPVQEAVRKEGIKAQESLWHGRDGGRDEGRGRDGYETETRTTLPVWRWMVANGGG